MYCCSGAGVTNDEVPTRTAKSFDGNLKVSANENEFILE